MFAPTSAPPAPEAVSTECIHNMLYVSWTPIPYEYLIEYGQIKQYIVTVKDLTTNHEVNILGFSTKKEGLV